MQIGLRFVRVLCSFCGSGKNIKNAVSTEAAKQEIYFYSYLLLQQDLAKAYINAEEDKLRNKMDGCSGTVTTTHNECNGS